MIATDAQVQKYVNERVRVRSEAIRNLYLACKDDKATIDDVFSAVSAATPTWSDNRTDGPPHLLVPNDVLSFNTFITNFIAFVEANGQYPVIQKSCVRGI